MLQATLGNRACRQWPRRVPPVAVRSRKMFSGTVSSWTWYQLLLNHLHELTYSTVRVIGLWMCTLALAVLVPPRWRLPGG